ncbi:MAG TPA: PBP1A family penicillin-binding protein [Thermoanaerobaculia bacterium]|nr:PBP1A family penicillin-binding protein [Thermoanaerobaculia bacterium]
MRTWTSPQPRRVSLHLWVYRHRVAILSGLAAVALLGLVLAAFATSVIVARFEGRRLNLPSRIYSDIFTLKVGDGSTPEKLVGKLERLLYQRDDASPTRAGRFRRDRNTVEVHARDFRYPGSFFRGFPVRVVFSGGRVAAIRDSADEPAPGLVLEPELLGSVFGEELTDRTPARLAELPQSLKDAVLVTEDRDFYRHAGISIRRSLGAVVANLKGGAVQGGSTLTQQLVKNLYLSPERTLRRKVIEAILALVLDARYSKDEIFETYLNEVYLGRAGAVAITGVGEAARHFFGKEPPDLDLAESATIAGMIKAPNIYSPIRNPARSRLRRNLVLRLMHEEKKIDDATLREALREPLAPSGHLAPRTYAPHFVDFVKAELAERYGAKLHTEGLQIFTTLDVDLQQAGQRAVTEGLAALEKNDRLLAVESRKAPLQGALIMLEPESGAVKVLVGGRDYRISQFNRVTQARRQPGSLFKPFVYLAAFSRQDLLPPITPATILEDTPITVVWDKGAAEQQWTPRDYEDRYRGQVSARQALELSINIPTVRVALGAGLPTVVAAARAAGLPSRLRPYPSIALGAFEISPMEIAAAYAVFANGGVRVEANALVGVTTSNGRVLDRKETPLKPVLPADAVFLVDSLMRGAVQRGTAAGARAGGVRGVLAGKTGTTNDYRDAWFVGFSPRFLAAVWVGFDDNRPVRLSGAQGAVPIFADFTRSVPPQFFAENFPVPSDIVTAEIDPETGFLATPQCPTRMTEVFISGTAPQIECPAHKSHWWSFLFRPAQKSQDTNHKSIW